MLQNDLDQQEVLENTETKAVDLIKENPQEADGIIDNNENLKSAQEDISLPERMTKKSLSVDDMNAIMSAHVTFKDFRDFKSLIENTPNALRSLQTILSSPTLSLDDLFVCSDFLLYLEKHQKDWDREFSFKEEKIVIELKNTITAKEQIFINLDYAEVFPTVESNIKTVLLDPNIISNIDASGGKRVANPSQLYADYLRLYADQKWVKFSELSLEDKQNAVYDIYKQDMLDSVEFAFEKMNNAGYGLTFLEWNQKNIPEYKIENVVLLLAKNSQGKEIYNLCNFLIENSWGGRTSFSDIQKVGFSNNPNKTQQQALRSMFNSLLAIETWYKNVVRDNDGKNENAYLIWTESFDKLPGEFTFYGSDQISSKLSDLYLSYTKKEAPSSIRFENSTVRKNTVNTHKWVTREYLTNPWYTSPKENQSSLAFFVSGSTMPKYMDFDKYTSWLEQHSFDHNEENIAQYLKNSNTPLVVTQNKIDQIWNENISEIVFDATLKQEYIDALQKKNSTIDIKRGSINQIFLNANVESLILTDTIWEQFFYRWDDNSESEKTKELIGNSLSELPDILEGVQNIEWVDPNSITVVISSWASNITYNWVHKNNEWLSGARANNVENGLISWLPTLKIEKQSEVAWPDYPPTAELLQKYFPDGSITMENWNKDDNLDTVEEKIYREYQYVKVGVEYKLKPTPKTTVDLDFSKKPPVYEYFGFEFTNPWVSTVAAIWGKNIDRSSIDIKAQKEVSKKIR